MIDKGIYSTIDEEQKTSLKQTVYPVVGACMEVHKVLGPFLNEYMYQEALKYELEDRSVVFIKEYYFSAMYKGRRIEHKHYMDFMCECEGRQMIVECKAIDNLGDQQRQQLWNYMRLSGIQIGILYNFAPSQAQMERY